MSDDKNCRHCYGTGMSDCPSCGGTGQYNDGSGDLKECKECDGRGECCCPFCDDGTPRKI